MGKPQKHSIVLQQPENSPIVPQIAQNYTKIKKKDTKTSYGTKVNTHMNKPQKYFSVLTASKNS